MYAIDGHVLSIDRCSCGGWVCPPYAIILAEFGQHLRDVRLA